jgi:hypothetical protein
MGAVSYAYADWVKDLAASAIAITSEDTNYPETNLQNEQVALCTRTTAKVAIKFQFDLGSAKQPQTFAILNHNFNGGTFDINSYTASNYTTGKTAVEANKAVRLLDVYHYESSAPSARQYWEFDFTNCAAAESYFEIGRIMAGGAPVQLTYVPDFTTPRGYGFRNIVNETSYGVRWSHRLAEKRERFGLTWGERAGATLATELRALYEAVYGNANPFLYIPDITAAACYYVYLDDPDLLYQEIFGTGTGSHSGGATLSLAEAVRGKV